MLNNKDYCDYDTCVALEELGFPIDWFEDETWHENNTNILLYSAQKWLRENHNLHISTKPYPNEGGLMWMFEIRRFTPQIICVDVNKTGFYDSEKALLEGIKEAIKILKGK